jgi:hypothetical protein
MEINAMGIIILIISCVALLALVVALLFLLKRKPRLELIALVLFLCAIAAIFLTWKPIYETRLPRFAADVKQVITPDELQKWALMTLKKSNPDSSELPLNDVPEPLRNLRSNGSQIEYAFYTPGTSPGDSYIVLMWGGGFGHWGIDVGAPSFDQPEDNNFYIKWAPGVYFWEETK